MRHIMSSSQQPGGWVSLPISQMKISVSWLGELAELGFNPRCGGLQPEAFPLPPYLAKNYKHCRQPLAQIHA